MKLNLKITNSNNDINQAILQAIKDTLNDCFSRSAKNLKNTISLIVKEAIMSEPEYNSLLSGKLQYELGIPNAKAAVDNIINIWSNNISINFNPIQITGNNLRGGFSINMIQSDYSDVLSSDSAVVIDDKKSISLPWLEWLLLHGGKIIIKNYKVQVGPSPYSRTGLAIMVKSNENWRVPPEFAGTENNNWVIRALNKLDGRIPKVIQEEIERNI